MLFNTDYLVVGAGASGLAFTDALVAEANVDVTVVDRQAAPGGHWLHAYPFVRLHTPSAYYGVNSLPLGEDRIDHVGENAGFYERATGGEVREHFAQAAARLTQTGRVRLLLRHEYLGRGSNGQQVRDLSTGEIHDVTVRRKVVDARYLEASIPATHALPFEVAASARVIPINDLPAAADAASSYAVLGSGKTAVDACVWLLDNGVEPDRIRWIRPRDAWFYDRSYFQPLEQVGAIMEGISRDAEAGAQAANVEEVFERLEASGRLVRIDPSWPATMYRGTMLSTRELEAVRRIEDVVRLGRVRRIEGRPDRARARGDPHRPRGPARRLHGARSEQRPRHRDLPARPDRAPASPLSLADFQRRPDRLRRGTSGRRRGQEPAVPHPRLPQQPPGLAAHDVLHVGRGGPLAARARPLSVDRQEPAQSHARAPRPRGRAVGAGRCHAVSHPRRAGDRAAEWLGGSVSAGGIDASGRGSSRPSPRLAHS